MHQLKHWAGPAVLIVGSLLSACANTAEADPASSGEEPATLAEVEGTDLLRVTLTESAAERLDLTTVAIRGGATGLVMPYGALLYDANGLTYAYVEVEPLAYMREEVDVAQVSGNRVVLNAGPPAGTPVVTVGAAELYGAEVGVDH